MPTRKWTALFFLVNIVLCGWFLDRMPNDNTMSRALAVSQLVDHQTLEITPLQELTGDKARIGDRYYSDKAPLPMLVMVPVWWLLRAADVVHAADGPGRFRTLLRVAGFVCGAIPLALIITLTWSELRRRTRLGPLWNVVLATLPFYGSFLFVYSGSFFSHLLGALFVLLALIAHDRERFMLAGLMAGLAVLCEYPLAVFPLCWSLSMWFRHGWKNMLRFAAGGAPALLVLMAYNLAVSGNAFSVGYQHETNYAFMDEHLGFGLPTWGSIVGLGVGVYRGLLVYMPVLLVCAIAGVVGAYARPSMLLRGVLPSLIVSFLVIAAYGMWWGGWAYGPRHLTAMAVLLAYRGIPLIAERTWTRWAAIGLSAIGLGCAFAAKVTFGYSLPSELTSPLTQMIFPAFVHGSWDDATCLAFLHAPAWVSNGAFAIVFIVGIFALSRIDRSVNPA
jgi:hypothetical protein